MAHQRVVGEETLPLEQEFNFISYECFNEHYVTSYQAGKSTCKIKSKEVVKLIDLIHCGFRLKENKKENTHSSTVLS